MHGHAHVANVDEVRALMLKKMVGEDEALTEKSKVDLSRLPPCRRVLYPHIKRVDHRVGQWKRSHITIYEMPLVTDHGWVWSEEGHLEPLWSDGPVLPLALWTYWTRMIPIICQKMSPAMTRITLKIYSRTWIMTVIVKMINFGGNEEANLCPFHSCLLSGVVKLTADSNIFGQNLFVSIFKYENTDSEKYTWRHGCV